MFSNYNNLPSNYQALSNYGKHPRPEVPAPPRFPATKEKPPEPPLPIKPSTPKFSENANRPSGQGMVNWL